MRIKKGELVLLLGKRHYIIPCKGKFSCKYGSLDMDKVVGKSFGTIVSIGKEKFVVVKPNLRDIMFEKFDRGPQVILPEDAAMIVAQTGIGKGSKVIEAGTGSAFLTCFLANIGCEVTSFEKRKDFYNKAIKNISKTGLRADVKNKDITRSRLPKNIDMIVLDMKNSENMIEKSYRSLKPGGWLVVYSLHVEQIIHVVKKLKRFSDIKIIETFQRKWQVEGTKRTFTRPKTHMIGHTGFLIFARKTRGS